MKKKNDAIYCLLENGFIHTEGYTEEDAEAALAWHEACLGEQEEYSIGVTKYCCR